MTRTFDLERTGEIDFTRQRDWYDPQRDPARVTLIGCGGIGSPTAICLSKLGISELALIDFDDVEPHNVPNQFYAMDQVDRPKVDALAEMCEAFGGADVTPVNGKGEDYPEFMRGIVVSGLDSMYARRQIWDQVKGNKNIELYVDGRLGGQDIVVYAFNPNDPDAVEYYEMEGLFEDKDALPLPCTARGIIDVSFQVASLITRQVRKFLTDQEVEYLLVLNQDNLGIDKAPGKSRSNVLKALERTKV